MPTTAYTTATDMLKAFRHGEATARRMPEVDARMTAHRLYFRADLRNSFEAGFRREMQRRARSDA